MERINIRDMVTMYIQLKDIAKPSARIKQCIEKLEDSIHKTIMAIKMTGIVD